MLPMFDKKKVASVIMERRGKRDLEVNIEVEAPESDMDPGLMQAAEDLLRAIDDRSIMDIARAMKAAHEICEMYEYEEGYEDMEE
ncbi:MAG: hypothetical protein IPL34_20180 [Thiofilum sp.]|uniref:hypothetical protein n=1 Tax=Thiofilum sp. TaxID=2212733 RepID=UPI0025F8B27E|nr:hypothetical protein [Thiofilum sp.]MBK8455600.1 hypothetical protein [Thiofilum sp.]